MRLRPALRRAALCGFAALLLLGCLAASAPAAGFGPQQASLSFTEEDGTPAPRAGSHPFALTASVTFDPSASQRLRNLRIVLPSGLTGTPAALPHCRHSAFLLGSCPPGSALGLIDVLARIESPEGPLPALTQAPLYNLDPLFGSGAELGMQLKTPGSSFPLTIQLGVDAQEPNLPYASLDDAPQMIPIVGYRLILWGNPADPAHDPYRAQCGSSLAPGVERFEALSAGSCPLTEDPHLPLLSLPASCAPSSARFEATSWSSPQPSIAEVDLPALTGCPTLDFAPLLSANPTSENANAPSGLDLRFDQPNPGLLSLDRPAGAELSQATFSLPPGLVIDPPLAAGLGYCTPEQRAAEALAGSAGEGCPQSSAIGSAELTTPLFEGPVKAEIYVAEPDHPATTSPGAENPFDSLFALYLVFKAPERGIVVIEPVLIEADPVTGRLLASLREIPQLPFDHLELHFDSGPDAPLATPPACASHSFAYSLQPSSANPPATGEQAFAIADNCPTPFQPQLSSQLGSSAAGSPTSLLLQLSTTSHEASPAATSLTLPPGLSAALGAVPLCPQAAAASGACPTGSRLGSLRVALGAGPEPLWVPAPSEPGAGAFLAGGYEGAPFSLVIRLAARAGPFDLGASVLRAPIAIDPATAQATIRIEAIPQILAGVPLRYREIRLDIDRPGFIRNPTSCAPQDILGTAQATDGALARLSSAFRADRCAALAFRPRVTLRLAGGLARNGHPSLRAAIRSAPGEASLAAASFTLPAGSLLDLRHLRALCPRHSTPAQCPPASRLGWASVWSPLAGTPLAGPIYLRRPRDGLPDLIVDLHGGQLHLILHGSTATPGGRLQVRFTSLPDLALTKALITLAGGKRGIIVNSESPCQMSNRGEASLTAHSGKRRLLRPHLRARC